MYHRVISGASFRSNDVCKAEVNGQETVLLHCKILIAQIGRRSKQFLPLLFPFSWV